MNEAQASLTAFLHAYVAGDRTARLALVDWLEEHGDPRAEAVRLAVVDWDAVAWNLFRESWPTWNRRRRPKRLSQLNTHERAELNRYRWWIDCALVSADAPAAVIAAVRQAHRNWLMGLFPEVAASLPLN